ncbi:hypothetical protein [Parendozoicomonas sp. Alg238-R29]|uniref:hypothetical protein n=1 Tax=Parendozoicomonas sp. Alg238-R29 TaxID=2993446 RepID=UPI00248E4816|nr:hypothetical protein [Parendozoicomonas sp. Alg238-R29]
MSISSLPPAAIQKVASSSATPEINKHAEAVPHKVAGASETNTTEPTALTKQFQRLKTMGDTDNNLVLQAKQSCSENSAVSSETIARAILNTGRLSDE